MSRLLDLLAPAHLALLAAILLWDVFIAGQIIQLRRVPRPLAALTALGGLLIAPALFVVVATSSLVYGRAIFAIAWVWPATLVLFALQAAYATARRRVTPFLGVPITIYDLLLAGAAITRYASYLGLTPRSLILALPAAQTNTLGLVMGSAALATPFAVQLPLFAPAFPARWRASKSVRAALAAVAAGSSAFTVLELPRGLQAVRSYQRYANERLQERPAGDFELGVRVFPDLDGAPPPLAVRLDLGLVDSIDVDVVSVVINPEGVRNASLDALARALDQLRRDSTAVVVALGYPARARERFAFAPRAYTAARLADVQRIARRLHPDYLLPALEPYDAGARAIGRQPVEYWASYLAAAAAAAHRADPRIRVGVAASTFDVRDSALYAWAAAAGSPLDVVGFSLFPSFRGALSLEARKAAADRWMRAARSEKEHWVFAAGGYPLTHGERSQELAIWGALAWATSRSAIRGLIVADAGDYDQIAGLRAPDGRLRRAAAAVQLASRGLREAEGP